MDLQLDFQMDERQAKLNADYQALLSQEFDEEITVIDKYVNPRAALLHYCDKCKASFWDRPLWLLKKRSHRCNITKPKPPASTKVTEEMREEMVRLYKNGSTQKNIAKEMGVSPYTVRTHLIKAGAIK